MKPDKRMQERIDMVESGEWKELPWFAFPGGCAMVYRNGHNEALCPECATKMLKDPEAYCYEKPVTGYYIESGEILIGDVVCYECDKVIEEATPPEDWDEDTWKSMGFTRKEWEDLCDTADQHPDLPLGLDQVSLADEDYSGMDQNARYPHLKEPETEVTIDGDVGDVEPQTLSHNDPEYWDKYPYWH